MMQLLRNVWTALKTAFNSVNWRDVMIRSLKTFAQAYAAFVGTALASGGLVYGVGESLWLSALAAGIAAAWNGVLSPAITAVWHIIDGYIGQKPPDVSDDNNG